MSDPPQEPSQPPASPPPPPYAAPPDWRPPTGPPYGWQAPYPAPGNTNGFAIASLVCGVLGLLVPFVGGVLGIVFGMVAIRQIDQGHGRGRGLAVAGIAVAAVILVLDVIGLAVLLSGYDTGSGSVGYPSV